jgi:hypothetical protein
MICVKTSAIFAMMVVLGIAWYAMYGKHRGIQAPLSTHSVHHIHHPPVFGMSSKAIHAFGMAEPPMVSPPMGMNVLREQPPIAINIATSHVPSNFQQVGILTRKGGKEMILPLMGRQVHTSRDSWNFYTVNDTGVRLPLSVKGKSGMSEYGCDNVYDGDSVYVEGYGDTFAVTRYETNTLRYI